MEKFTRRIVGWQILERMTGQLVIDAFNRARHHGLIKRGSIIHTDRSSQYASVEYRRLLYIHGFRQSMCGKGNCYDNALRRTRFFSRFKAELFEGGIFESVEQARSEILSYIVGYYNWIRRHSSLVYLSPLEARKTIENKKSKKQQEFILLFFLTITSGTEPLVRVYAEAESKTEVETLLSAGSDYLLC